ncbi:hypothetical protein [Halobacteriovorax sp. JY17]|uniref:hypothetical protein n=1 Tax=Halobacteriovorax sp. JY17 TaxID=2014617 RepID=UPI000C4FADB7|nr:hypothetical protein [Halobacteriovorax sp. JY17]PIK15567.1 MAG: hypothetical protein CES88_02260 [Halobacteriovorax sp. JY17]
MFKVLLSFLSISSVYAADLNISTYIKCHQQFTNQRVSSDSKVLLKIRSGEVSSQKACINLLEKASLNKNLQLKEQNPKTIAILKNIQSLHNSWFKLYNLNRETQDHGVTNVTDADQMAYYYTVALLSKDIPYSSVFTSTDTIWAKRKGSEENIYSNDKDIQGRRSKIDGTGLRKWLVGGVKDNPDDYGDEYFWNPTLVEFGELIGFQRIKEHSYFKRLKEGKKLDQSSLTKNLFPGAFGSVPYLILNLGHDNEKTDGGYKIHRRFASNFFSDFLCRDLPVIEERDIHPQKESKISFRNQKSCMACHETMDQFASLTSNLEIFNAGEVHTNAYVFRGIYQYKKSSNSNYQYTDKDPDFYQKKHSSRLYFRDYLGKLVNKEISDSNRLGEVIKKLDDPYLCTISRYFYFLTGIRIDLNNFTSMNKESDLRDFLIKLTKDLKTNQSTLKTIEEIIKSKYYISSNGPISNE